MLGFNRARDGGKWKGQSRFCTKTNGPKEYMDTHGKRQVFGFRAGTGQ